MKIENKELVKEKIPLAVIFRQNGVICIDFTTEANKSYEIFGFLKCLVNKMEEDLTMAMGEHEQD